VLGTKEGGLKNEKNNTFYNNDFIFKHHYFSYGTGNNYSASTT